VSAAPPLPSRQRCEQCAHEIGELDPAAVCPRCGGLLELEHAASDGAATLRARFAARRSAMTGPDHSGVWRYRELVLPTIQTHEIVSHPEGNTPLLARPRVAGWVGV